MQKRWVEIRGLIILSLALLVVGGCEDAYESDDSFGGGSSGGSTPVVGQSIAPASYGGRANVVQGCVDTQSRVVRIFLWDHGQIDGDIVSLIVNGRVVVEEVTIDGPSNRGYVDVTLQNVGYNYILLWAHNLGDIPPNTAAIEIQSDQGSREFIMEANLETNGVFDVVVEGSGVTCQSSGPGGGSTDPDPDPVDEFGGLAVWTSQDFGCGPITVQLAGQGQQTITGYHSSGINGCAAPDAANFTGLTPGTYELYAVCTELEWSGQVTIEAGVCSELELN